VETESFSGYVWPQLLELRLLRVLKMNAFSTPLNFYLAHHPALPAPVQPGGTKARGEDKGEGACA
jgi:hypothetical protein